MNCVALLNKCHAECCGPCPIPIATWRSRQADVQGEIEYAEDDGSGFVHALTTDGNCPFKSPKTYRCVLYPAQGQPDPRNPVCAKFGDESHPCMTCRWQDKDGRVRSRGERKQVSREIMRATDLIIARIHNEKRK